MSSLRFAQCFLKGDQRGALCKGRLTPNGQSAFAEPVPISFPAFAGPTSMFELLAPIRPFLLILAFWCANSSPCFPRGPESPHIGLHVHLTSEIKAHVLKEENVPRGEASSCYKDSPFPDPTFSSAFHGAPHLSTYPICKLHGESKNEQ